jgi:ABC-type bacteriocin/lantibiotic exporter with double-glycine peptidase domain
MNTLVRLALVALVALTSACILPYKGGARTMKPQQLDATWLRAAPTPVIKQKRQSDCGLAALAMVAGAWGHRWSVDDMAARVPPGNKGVKLRVLRDFARSRGLEAYAIKATRQDLHNELAKGRPVLLGLILPHDMRRNRSHYEVAIALDPKTGTVITIDPANGNWMRRSKKVLDLEWKEAGYAALVVVADRSKSQASASATQTSTEATGASP